MKFFIIGDTHHKLDKVRNVYDRLKGVDMILHTGDYVEDAIELEKELGIPVVYVYGNCDNRTISANIRIVESECGNILITHGHMQGVDYSYDKLLYLAEENNCMAVIFGHTHLPVYEEWDGIYLINPGSLSKPRDGSQGSYAVVTTTESTFAGSIIYYNSVFEKNKTKGGYIKDMLNYSDRF